MVKKKLIIMFMALVAIMGFTTSCQDYNDDIINLQEEVELNKQTLESEINTLNAQLAALQVRHDEDVKALNDAIDALEALTSEQIAAAKAEAIAVAQKAYEDAVAHADEVAKQEALKALEDAKAYAAEVASAEALAAKQAAIVAANEAAQKMVSDAVVSLNDAIRLLEEKHDKDVKDLKDGLSGEEQARKDADVEIWNALNNAVARVETAENSLTELQKLAGEAKDLANANKAAIEAEVARAKSAEGVISNAVNANADEITKLWNKCNELATSVGNNAERIEKVYSELNGKLDVLVGRIKAVEDQVGALDEAVKEVNSKINTHDARIEALEVWTKSYQKTIENLASEMETAKDNINELYTKLADEVSAREDADETLAISIGVLFSQVADEINAREAADNDLYDKVSKLAADLRSTKDELSELKELVNSLNKAIADEQTERKQLADKFTNELNTLSNKLSGVNSRLISVENRLNDAIGGYEEKLAVLTEKVKHLFGNDFRVVTDVFFHKVLSEPTYEFNYYSIEEEVVFPFDGAKNAVTVETDTIAFGEAIQTPGQLVVTLNPTTEDWTGKNLFLYDEKGTAHPVFQLKNTKPYDGDYLFTRADGGQPRYSADIVGGELTSEQLVSKMNEEPVETDEVVPLYAVAAEYYLYDNSGNEVRELCYSEFKFDGTYKTNGTKLDGMVEKDIVWIAELSDEFEITTSFDGFNNGKDSLHYVYCSTAINACGDTIAEAADYVNTLGNYAKVINAADMTDEWVDEIDSKYGFYTFVFSYYVMDVNGNVFKYEDRTVVLGSNVEPASNVLTFAVTPESADVQVSEALPIPSELVWNDNLPECSQLTATVIPMNPGEGIQFGFTSGKLYPEFDEELTSEPFGKDEAEAANEVYVSYNPALLEVGETYFYVVIVKFGDLTVSETTLNVVMMRPEGYDFDDLEKITSAWNKDKTRTIVWAQGFIPGDFDNSETANQNAWYDLDGSFTNLPGADANPKEDGTELGFYNVTEKPYTAETRKHGTLEVGEIVELPSVSNGYVMTVPYTAVLADDSEVSGRCNWMYKLEYGTKVFGLDNLYGHSDEHQFEISYESPIYYDGVVYDYSTGNYEGGCVLVGEENLTAVDGTKYPEFYIEFPKMSYSISEINLIGSNDPSTSSYDPIKYFGEIAPDYATWQTDRDAVYIDKTSEELKYRDARIYNVSVELGQVPYELTSLNDYTIWNDPTNEYLFEELPRLTENGISFKTYDKYPSLQAIPAFYYVLKVTDIWGLVKEYPFIITIRPNTK